MELFLPGMVVSAENQGTFSDYHWHEPDSSILLSGGTWEGLSEAGVMISDIWGPAESLYRVGSRLSKN